MCFRKLRCVLFVILTTLFPSFGWAQQYAGFIDDVKNGTSDSLMNINGVEYYLLFEDYENVHFLSLGSARPVHRPGDSEAAGRRNASPKKVMKKDTVPMLRAWS